MKRKGFTLVELLIVIAILGVLSATMMINVSGSTSGAKASAIATNIAECRRAAALYCYEKGDGGDANIDTSTTAKTVITTYVGTWSDFSTGNIKYTAEGEGRENWVVKVDFSAETDKDNIATALAKIKGFGNYGDKKGGEGADKDNPADSVVSTGKFKVTLWTGKVEADA